MFFDKKDVAVSVLDVLELDQSNISLSNKGRHFDAISFRYSADTHLHTADNDYYLGDNSVSFVPADFEYLRVSNHDHLIVVHFNTLNYTFNQIEFFVTENPEKFGKLFKKILKCKKDHKPGYRYECNAILNSILAECFKENYKSEKPESPIANSVAFMRANFSKCDLTMKEVAAKSFISEVYFRRLFKREYGISPNKYLINLRLRTAINLIETNYYSLKEVAELSGYSDYSYFSSEFKRIKGVTPSEYFYNYEMWESYK